MTNALQVTQLKKSYGKKAVLKGLDLHVRRGEIFALLGANGAGKMLSDILFPAELLPTALVHAGKLFPASWGYLFMAKTTH